MKLTQRLATPADEAFARDTHHQALHDVVVAQFGAWDVLLQDGFFQRGWEARPNNILLYDDTPCGYVTIEEASDHIYVHELVIHPDFQGKKIGTNLLEELFKKSTFEKIPVRLQVLHKNKAQHLYKRLGFVQSGQTETHFLMERPSP
jgi:ribosomal protein S18 acetylase RimI-like enzyme